MVYTSTFTCADGKVSITLSSDEASVREKLATLDNDAGEAANYLWNIGYDREDIGNSGAAVLYAVDASLDEAAQSRNQQLLTALEAKFGMDSVELPCAAEKGQTSYLMAVPDPGQDAAGEPKALLHALVEQSFIRGAWPLELHITEDSLTEDALVQDEP